MDIAELAGDYDWCEAFSVSGYSLGDVREIVAFNEGANDEESWIILFKSTNERFVFLTAWCDYTGWDCQSGGNYYMSTDLRDLVLGQMGDEDRKRLGFDNDGNRMEAQP